MAQFNPLLDGRSTSEKFLILNTLITYHENQSTDLRALLQSLRDSQESTSNQHRPLSVFDFSQYAELQATAFSAQQPPTPTALSNSIATLHISPPPVTAPVTPTPPPLYHPLPSQSHSNNDPTLTLHPSSIFVPFKPSGFNAKGSLQEYCQRNKFPTPRYLLKNSLDNNHVVELNFKDLWFWSKGHGKVVDIEKCLADYAYTHYIDLRSQSLKEDHYTTYTRISKFKRSQRLERNFVHAVQAEESDSQSPLDLQLESFQSHLIEHGYTPNNLRKLHKNDINAILLLYVRGHGLVNFYKVQRHITRHLRMQLPYSLTDRKSVV